MTTLIVHDNKLFQELADAISTGNINAIHDLLNEDGMFIIADSKLELQETDKYGLDQSIHCKIGNPMILFDDGGSLSRPKIQGISHTRST
jgi:hypothetical protein